MSLRETKDLQHFYINEEQSFYLLSHSDARKLKDWLRLCESQLKRLGYSNIELIGNGAYGFVFAGTSSASDTNSLQYVFKFSRITLPQHIKDRLEEEGFMLSLVEHQGIPEFIAFQNMRGQSILMMSRAPGINLQDYARQVGPLEPRLILKIAAQMADILLRLRNNPGKSSIVHGDIKPSNIMFDEQTETVSLIDWGAAVIAQYDEQGQRADGIGLDAMNAEFQQTNAKLGDIYFIGDEQLQGACSSPRFDEQGLAGTLYALASGQGSRFGSQVIRPQSLNLPIEFARTLAGMLDKDLATQYQAGDYFFANMRYMKHIVDRARPATEANEAAMPLIPVALVASNLSTSAKLETVVYSSRKGFLRQQIGAEAFFAQPNYSKHPLAGDLGGYRDDRNYLSGMGDTEKAFVIAVTHLGCYSLIGGLAVNWDDGGVYIDSSLNLYDRQLEPALTTAINNVVHLGRALSKKGVFKSCMFDARKTLHISRKNLSEPFVADPSLKIDFELAEEISITGVDASEGDSEGDRHDQDTRLHSYFEDGSDPDEMLHLPESIMQVLARMNQIHHTGCIIFEAVEQDLKIHNYLTLLDGSKEPEFRDCLNSLLAELSAIEGLGVSGFMKLPYKNTKFFNYLETQPDFLVA
ncbi:phosphotransferase [SAR92 clade bacterium H455]|uniref:Phosphotransferase n=1 Tax=SAR92 clade bacterium H455 TaxID=2974818 RepID=A0ABY5TQG9_9GAMM|nr:phosphotransferase [SAR92 clade bacterium H455]